MLFSELYSAYYNALAAILKEALSSPISDERIAQIAKERAFGESFVTIRESLKNGSWPLLKEDRTSVIENPPEMPLTVLQKRWLKALTLDPRFALFGVEAPDLADVEPLFRAEDFCVFDRYSDGDDYANKDYIAHFQTVLDAVKNRYPLQFLLINRFGRYSRLSAQPEYLEYSEKDDKFRVGISGFRYGDTVNLGRIVSCKRIDRAPGSPPLPGGKDAVKVVLTVTDERNALERVLFHFAHFAKEAERLSKTTYKVTIGYDREDETEMVIRILSFGPMVKVEAPEEFKDLIKKRLTMQKNLK